jgi:signal transduction histidine kinase
MSSKRKKELSLTTGTNNAYRKNAPEGGPDPIAEIPSPSRRVWLGLCIILATFGFFAWYMTGRIHRLEEFQRNVVQRNRKSSLQLLRLQNDTYLLAISIRDMALDRGPYSLQDWKPAFSRLRDDMRDAVRLDGKYATSSPQANGFRRLLRARLDELSGTADQVFALAAGGRQDQARAMVESRMETERTDITSLVARLLVTNDQAQAEAAGKINGIYQSARRDILFATGLLFLLAVATGLYVLEASRRAFGKLRHLAEQLRSQSAHLRELSWRLIDLQEQTLRRIAVDLHDEFGQILTAVGLLLKRSQGEEDPAERRQYLETVSSIVRETLQKVRDQSQMMHPATLEDFGLEQTLEWFVEQYSRQTGITVELRTSCGQQQIPPENAIHLYRIVQQALNNVARHAHASRAWVVLRAEQEHLTIEIGDDGVGFEPPGAGAERSPARNLGLTGMRERAEHLRGSLTIQSSPGRGTVVRVRVALSHLAEVAQAPTPVAEGM